MREIGVDDRAEFQEISLTQVSVSLSLNCFQLHLTWSAGACCDCRCDLGAGIYDRVGQIHR